MGKKPVGAFIVDGRYRHPVSDSMYINSVFGVGTGEESSVSGPRSLVGSSFGR